MFRSRNLNRVWSACATFHKTISLKIKCRIGVRWIQTTSVSRWTASIEKAFFDHNSIQNTFIDRQRYFYSFAAIFAFNHLEVMNEWMNPKRIQLRSTVLLTSILSVLFKVCSFDERHECVLIVIDSLRTRILFQNEFVWRKSTFGQNSSTHSCF